MFTLPAKPVLKSLCSPLLVLLLSAPALAQSATVMPETAAGSVLQMLFGLVIVLAALFGTLMVLRRLQGGRTHLVGGLKVIGATNVGPRERVVLLSVGSKVLVLGVTQGRISALQTLDASEVPLPEPAPAPTDFAQRLRQILENARAR